MRDIYNKQPKLVTLLGKKKKKCGQHKLKALRMCSIPNQKPEMSRTLSTSFPVHKTFVIE